MVQPVPDWSPPYIYVGLAEYEDCLKAEAEREKERERAAEEVYWRSECERGGMHRFGTCPYCGYYFD